MFWCLNVCTVLDFWKNREKQLLEFYEQLDRYAIGEYLKATESPCMETFREIMETAMTGRYIDVLLLACVSVTKINILFSTSETRDEPRQCILGDAEQAYQLDWRIWVSPVQGRLRRVVDENTVHLDKLSTFSKLRLHCYIVKSHL